MIERPRTSLSLSLPLYLQDELEALSLLVAITEDGGGVGLPGKTLVGEGVARGDAGLVEGAVREELARGPALLGADLREVRAAVVAALLADNDAVHAGRDARDERVAADVVGDVNGLREHRDRDLRKRRLLQSGL